MTRTAASLSALSFSRRHSSTLVLMVMDGRELRQRYARKRWSLIEFACVSLTGRNENKQNIN